MSSPLFQTDLLFIQRILSSAGLYHGTLDGKHSSDLDNAETAFNNATLQIAHDLGTFDPRTENVISTLVPKAQKAARQFMNLAKSMPFTVKLISGTRTYAEQDILFAKRPKVTNARGGQSNHNFGIAWDVGIFNGGIYNEGRNNKENQQYIDLSKLIMPQLGNVLTWGGNWHSIIDMPHYELTSNKSISQVRSLFEAGRAYV